VLGPLSYAELVRRIVAGEVGPELTVRREGAEGEPPELRRYLSSNALGWKDAAPVAGQRERGAIDIGKLLAIALRLGTTRATGLLELIDAPPPRPDGATGEPRATRKKRIFFVDGKPHFVASNDPHELLGEFLVKNGICMRMELDMALAVLDRYEGRLADALVGLGAVRPLALVSAIERQVRERYLEAFRWRSGSWSFTEGVRAGEESVALVRGPPEPLYDPAGQVGGNTAEAALAPLRERVVTKVMVPPAPLASFGVPATWTSAIQSVDGKTTLSGLLMRAQREHGLDVEDAYRVYHFGLACSLLKAGSAASRA